MKGFVSTVVLAYLLQRSWLLTPEIWHFITCLSDNQGHIFWISILWASFKGGFTDPQAQKSGFFELTVALFVTRQNSWESFFLLSSVITVLALRKKHPQLMNVALAYFVLYYLSINLCVNTFDFFKNFVFEGITYRHDDDFVSSFSYKTHQLVLVVMLSFVSAIFTNPVL